ncbi:hypothetical protein BU26DRAFT_505744 [Trematosphaeria pertusa]|uniref:Uncharacterized protein n=1 Tax=Trematosphaeria pertusa TaxID=390896 RepID=A0A6A6IEN3_9PLEO|nr:uncharacterized protein BU26DRAFT_505744 [Trematosphaeria pertusa]KAF2247973.1 hypothetical protein BU26DRAFT_505744 [Trematosphaeria pertusa]
MGWLWSSSPSSKKPASQPEPDPTPPPATITPSAPIQKPSSPPDADADDFHAAFPHLAPSPTTTTSPSTSPTPPQDPSATTTSTPGDSDYDPTLPTTMSCRAAFDAAFYCSSLGGHFNSIYRYGQLRSCSEHWADWRFCMALKGSSAEARARAIQARYREKEERIRQKPSSEDVWERRRMPEEMVVAPFGKAEEEARRVEGSGS